MARKGIENLHPFTSENAAENGRKGGLSSGRTRRFAKTFKEALERESEKKVVTKAGDKINGFEALAGSLYREAMKGNTRAAELVIKIMNQMPADKHEVTGADGAALIAPGAMPKLSKEDLAKVQELNEQLK